MKIVTILLADDHQLITNGISQILTSVDNFEVCAITNNGRDALEKINSQHPDIAILDIEMPGLSGIDILENIKGNNSTKVIILSVYEDISLIRKCLRYGAKGYLFKRSDPDEIIDAINKISNGGKYVSPEVSEVLLTDDVIRIDNKKHNLQSLTKRELEILNLIVDGLCNSEIAEKLFISKRTVDTHRVNLMGKLDVHNTVELVKFALLNGI